MSYVPDYRTSQYRAPVTYYRPLVTTDPNTGSQVVALAPCTSYEYQTQRIPTFGYNGVMGSYSTPPVVPPPPSMPTYTLPSGGVPLASNGPAAVSATEFGRIQHGLRKLPKRESTWHSSFVYERIWKLQPIQQLFLAATRLTPAANSDRPACRQLPDSTLASAPGYYGSVSGGSTGGCTGSLSSPSYTPGLVAPPATPYNSSPIPYTPAPNYQPNYPLSPAPSTTPGLDPAGDRPPVLPPPGNPASVERPQLRAIVRQPSSNDTYSSSTVTEKNAPTDAQPSQGLKMDPFPCLPILSSSRVGIPGF